MLLIAVDRLTVTSTFVLLPGRFPNRSAWPPLLPTYVGDPLVPLLAVVGIDVSAAATESCSGPVRRTTSCVVALGSGETAPLPRRNSPGSSDNAVSGSSRARVSTSVVPAGSPYGLPAGR